MAPKAKTESTLLMLDPRTIMANEHNPRAEIGDTSELAASIASHGILQPIVVRPHGASYKVVAGSRRLACALALNLESIPVRVVTMDDEQAHEAALAENIIRKDMSAVDEIKAIEKMTMDGESHVEIAARFGRTPRWVSTRAKIALMPKCVLEFIGEGKLSIAAAEELCRLGNDVEIEKLASESANRGYGLSLVRSEIDDMLRDLADAPWVDGKSDCAKCLMRSDKQINLFEDGGPARCMDSVCWAQKSEKWIAKTANDLRAKGHLPKQEFQSIYMFNECYGPILHEVRDADEIKELIEAGVKPRFRICEDTYEVIFRYDRDDMPEKTVKTASSDDAAVEDDMDDDHLPDATEMDGETNAEGEAPEDDEPSQPSEWQLQRLARQKAEQVRDYAKRTICEEYREDGRVIDWEKLLPFVAELIRVNTGGNAINKFASEKDNARTERGEPELETLVHMHPADIMDALLETLFEEMDVTKEIPALVKACGLDYDSCVGMVEHEQEQKKAEVEA